MCCRLSNTRVRSRSGAALLFTMFVLTFVVLMTVNVLDSTTLELSALRNSIDYERALYLANAGVHEIAAQLETDITWRGTVTDGAFPADNTFTATAADGPAGYILVTSSGVSGDVTRSLEVLVE